MSSPRSVDVAVTGRCNLACRYCFYADEMVSRGDLPSHRWLAFFGELGRLGVMDVTLTGGELFTRPDIFDLIDGVVSNRMRYQILSNGTLITEKVLTQFELGKRRLRLNSIQVSIDGSCAEIHNLSRPNSFNQALRGLRLLVAHGLPATVRVTINPHNVDDLDNVAQLLLEDVGVPSVSTNEAFPMGAGKCSGESVVLTRYQRQRAMDTLLALSERYGGRISAQAGPLALARHFAEVKDRMARGEGGVSGAGTLAACGGVFQKLSVSHDGTILPCHMLPDLPMGMIGIDDLADAWRHHPAITAVRERSKIPTNSLETCRECPYAGFCTAGCPGMVMNVTGKLTARDPRGCYRIHMGVDPEGESLGSDYRDPKM